MGCSVGSEELCQDPGEEKKGVGESWVAEGNIMHTLSSKISLSSWQGGESCNDTSDPR